MQVVKYLPLLMGSALLLSACAPTQNGRSMQKINDVSHTETEVLRAYGAEHAYVLGPAFLKSEGRCSEIDFLKFVSTKYAEAEDIINVRMEESSSKSGMEVTYSCKYSGLAVAYKSMTAEEAKAWKQALPKPEVKEEQEEGGFFSFGNKKGKTQAAKPAARPAAAPVAEQPAEQPAEDAQAEQPAADDEYYTR